MTAVRAILATSAALTLLPATASAATVTVTGDDGNPVPINTSAPTVVRNMDVAAAVVVTESDTPYYTTQVVDPAGTPASTASPCRPTRYGGEWTNHADYRGNGNYTLILRYFKTSDCASATSEQRYLYAISAGTAVTAPATTLMTRQRNSFSTITHKIPVALNPGALSYEVRYARGGVIGPDGAISGPSGDAYLDRTTGLADLRFTEPGRYVVVARVKADDYYTPWSAPATVTVKAPFDLSFVTFPDARGPSYKLRGQLRDDFARGRVTIRIAKGRKGGKFRRIGRSSKINSKGRFTRRFKVRRPGVYRLRYSYKGSSLVTKGRVTEAIRVRRTVRFG